MGILEWLRPKKETAQQQPQKEQRSKVTVLREGPFSLVNGETFYVGGDDSEAATIEEALTTSTLVACLNVRSGDVGTLPLVVKNRLPDQVWATEYDHRLAKWFRRRPSPSLKWNDFIQWAVGAIDVWGNAFSHIELTATGWDIYPLPSAQVQHTTDGNGNPVFAFVPREGEQPIIFQPQEILHFKGNTFGQVTGNGTSMVEAAARLFGMSLGIDRHMSRFFTHGVMAQGYISSDSRIQDEDKQAIKEAWRRNYQGVSNSWGEIPILDMGTKFNTMALSARDSRTEQLASMIEAKVCGAMRVPLFLVNNLTGAASASNLVLMFENYINSLQPTLDAITNELNSKLLLESEKDTHRIEFDTDKLVMTDPAARNAAILAQVAAGVETKQRGAIRMGLSGEGIPDWALPPPNQTAPFPGPDEMPTETDHPPEDGDTEGQGSQDTETEAETRHLLPVVQQVLARLQTKETKALQRAAKRFADDAEGMKEWRSEFNAKHHDLIVTELQPIAAVLKLEARAIDTFAQNWLRTSWDVETAAGKLLDA